MIDLHTAALELAAAWHGVEVSDLTRHNRCRHIVAARHAAWSALRQATTLTLEEIGNGWDHGSVFHGIGQANIDAVAFILEGLAQRKHVDRVRARGVWDDLATADHRQGSGPPPPTGGRISDRARLHGAPVHDSILAGDCEVDRVQIPFVRAGLDPLGHVIRRAARGCPSCRLDPAGTVGLWTGPLGSGREALLAGKRY